MRSRVPSTVPSNDGKTSGKIMVKGFEIYVSLCFSKKKKKQKKKKTKKKKQTNKKKKQKKTMLRGHYKIYYESILLKYKRYENFL